MNICLSWVLLLLLLLLSDRGLCDKLITRGENFYRLWCVVVCDLETSWMRRPWPNGGLPPPKYNLWYPILHDCTTCTLSSCKWPDDGAKNRNMSPLK